MLVLKGLVGLHRTVQLQLLQCYWLGLLSHGRGIGIQDALKEDFRGLSRLLID